MPSTPTTAIQRLKAKQMAAPADPRLKHELQQLIRKQLPVWHLPMINDKARNSFYEKLITGKVQDKTVLEIGTGTGFLSLLAAQAGAKHVYTCEENPIFQEIAQQTIEAGPHKSKITLIPKSLSKLKLKVDVPEKVDMILSEIISTDIFAEGMIDSLTRAKKFLKPNGIFLPDQIEVLACLVGPQDEHAPENHAMSKPIVDYLAFLPRMNPASKPFERLSNFVSLTTLKHGYLFSAKPPWKIQLKRNRESDETLVCIYFRIIDGGNTLTNFMKQHDDPTSELYATSWGQVFHPVGPGETYDLKIHLLNDLDLVVTQT